LAQLEKERTACLLELGVSISLQLEDPFLDVIQLVDIATDGIYLLTHKKKRGGATTRFRWSLHNLTAQTV
jgi:hypothetical protein